MYLFYLLFNLYCLVNIRLPAELCFIFGRLAYFFGGFSASDFFRLIRLKFGGWGQLQPLRAIFTTKTWSYDVLRQQKTVVMTKGLCPGGALTSLCLRRITSSPSQTLRRRLVQTTDDGRRGEWSTLAAVRRSRLCFSHFATRTVDNTVDLYAAKPDIRPESRFCLPHLHSSGSRQNIATPFGMKKTRMVWLPDGKKISKISLFVLAQFRNVLDGQTDTQADRHRMTT